MKRVNYLLFAVLGLVMCSCAQPGYQIVKMTPVGQSSVNSNAVVFEDEYCRISYNLWSEKGDAGFMIFNKGDENIYLDLTESFYVRNGQVFDYYLDRSFTNTSSVSGRTSTYYSTQRSSSASFGSGISSGSMAMASALSNGHSSTVAVTQSAMTTSGNAVSYAESRVLCIPPNTFRIVSEYVVSTGLYRDCNLLMKMYSANDEKSVHFSQEESPLTFTNIVSYRVGNSPALRKIETTFYVSDVSNRKQSSVTEKRFDEFCGDKASMAGTYFTVSSPDSYYIVIGYNNSTSAFKH